MRTKVQIYLLGQFKLIVNDEAVPDSAWHTRQACQLLKILAVANGKPMLNDTLRDYLWQEKNSATTLRTAVNALRKVLEPKRLPNQPSQYILTCKGGYALAMDKVWLDVREFENLLYRARHIPDLIQRQKMLVEAHQLYRGDFLAYDLYEDWAVSPQQQRREMFLKSLEELADIQSSTENYAAAIATAQKIIQKDNCRESGYLRLINYYLKIGDKVKALQSFEVCCQNLKHHLDILPSQAILNLQKQIISRQDLIAPFQNSLPNRAYWHKQVAEGLVQLYGTNPQEQASLILHHFKRAGLPEHREEVLHYGREAANFTLQEKDYRNTLRLCDEALSVLDFYDAKFFESSQSQKINDLYNLRAQAAFALGDWEHLNVTLQAIEKWAKLSGNLFLPFNYSQKLMTYFGSRGNRQQLLNLFNQEIADQAQYRLVADCLSRYSLLLQPLPENPLDVDINVLPVFQNPAPVIAFAWQQIPPEMPPLQAIILLYRYGWAIQEQGFLEQAERCFKVAMLNCEELGHAGYWILIAIQLSHNAFRRDDYEKAFFWLKEGQNRLNQFRELDWLQVWLDTDRAYLHLQTGEVGKAETLFQTIKIKIDQGIYNSHRNRVQIGLGLVALAQEKYGLAQEYLNYFGNTKFDSFNFLYVQQQQGLAKLELIQGDKQTAFKRLVSLLQFTSERTLDLPYRQTLNALPLKRG